MSGKLTWSMCCVEFLSSVPTNRLMMTLFPYWEFSCAIDFSAVQSIPKGQWETYTRHVDQDCCLHNYLGKSNGLWSSHHSCPTICLVPVVCCYRPVANIAQYVNERFPSSEINSSLWGEKKERLILWITDVKVPSYNTDRWKQPYTFHMINSSLKNFAPGSKHPCRKTHTFSH